MAWYTLVGRRMWSASCGLIARGEEAVIRGPVPSEDRLWGGVPVREYRQKAGERIASHAPFPEDAN